MIFSEDLKANACKTIHLFLTEHAAIELNRSDFEADTLCEKVIRMLELHLSPEREREVRDILEDIFKAGISLKTTLELLGGAFKIYSSTVPAISSDTANSFIEASKLISEWFLKKAQDGSFDTDSIQREIDGFPDSIAATIDANTLYRAAVKKIDQLLDDSLKVYIVVHDEGTLRLAASNDEIEKGKDIRGSCDEFKMLDVNKGCAYITLRGSDLEKELLSLIDKDRAALAVFGHRGRATGAILASADEDLSERDEIVLRRFAGRLAVASENAILHTTEQKKIKETVALLEVARVISSTIEMETILNKVVQMGVDLCETGLCEVFLYYERNGAYVLKSQFGFIQDQSWKQEQTLVIPKAVLPNHIASRLESGEPTIVTNQTIELFMNKKMIEKKGINCIQLIPLISKENMIGFLTQYHFKTPEKLYIEDLSVMAAIASQAAMAIENAMLYESIERSYFSTVRALARAIEVKDKYTMGHSEKVTEYALCIAERLGLSESEIKDIKYASTLHDIGKIGIEGRVLNKPKSLTDKEFLHVKTHPLLGDSIIEPVEFLQSPRPLILHHHERYDGNGYPDGLKGEMIPLGARIISIADAYEAMRSDRPYRKALDPEDAMTELKRCMGTQFDPGITEVFISLLEENPEMK